MIDGSVLQSAQRCFQKKSRVVVKMVVTLKKQGKLEGGGLISGCILCLKVDGPITGGAYKRGDL